MSPETTRPREEDRISSDRIAEHYFVAKAGLSVAEASLNLADHAYPHGYLQVMQVPRELFATAFTEDLKPTTYFFPERDIAQGKLAPESTKNALADELDGKLVLTRSQAEAFTDQLKRDTELLASTNSVDYSLFLLRIPVPPSQQTPIADNENHENPFSDNAAHPEHNSSTSAESQRPPDAVPVPANPPFTPPSPPSWRTGVKSADGKYVYRAAVLDFFWAKHKTHAKIMTHLVDLLNRVDLGGNNGPMSITTSSDEYRERFIEMCEGYIETRRSGKEDDDE